jgi:hypothetical protein
MGDENARTEGSTTPTIVALVVILALLGGFALLGGRSLVKPAGGDNAPVTGQVVEGATAVSGGVQRITVDSASGVYDPNVIVAKPGVPLEITFKPGIGCLSAVLVPRFSIQQDIQSGAVVKVPAMQPGEYPFSCGMRMVFGKIVVR